MKMDRQFIKPLTEVASSLDTFIEKPNRNNFERLNGNVDRIMGQLFIYHSNPVNHKDPSSFMGSLITAGRRESTDFSRSIKKYNSKK